MKTLTDDLVRDYAAGLTSPGIALLVATQMSQAPGTRAGVARAERLGGAFLGEMPRVALDDGALDAVLDRIDADGEDSSASGEEPSGDGPLPDVLMRAIGRDFDRIPWRFRLPGVSEYQLPGFEGEHVSLLRARPGASVPQHTHEGQEATLVLTGAMEDGGRVLAPGDVAINDEHDEHKPRIVGTDICHCLIVMSGALRFTGRFGRALNLLAE